MHDMHEVPDWEGLIEKAQEQGGYVTSKQAGRYGYSWALLSHHATSGKLHRAHHGVYRIRDYPSGPYDEIYAAWLAVGPEEALVSHESALSILGLSDVIPDEVHLMVPRKRRWIRAPRGVRLHTTTRSLAQSETVVRSGLPLTVPARSIVDAAEEGMAPDQVVRAVQEALERGLTTPQRLISAAGERGGRVKRLVQDAIHLHGI